jgi:Zn-dependent M16 (insulinase) family peptidase
LATLPKLGIEDLGDAPEKFPFEEKRQNAPKVLFHDLFTNKIGYVQVGFDTKAVPVNQLQYLSLLGRLILEMGTKKSSFVEITQRMGIHTGGIRTSHFSSLRLGDKNNIVSQLFFSGKAVLNKLDELFDIYRELLGEFDFSDSKRLLDIIRGAKADMEASIVPAGNQYVISRLNSYYSLIGRYDEFTDGLAYFRFLEDLLERVEKKPDEVANSFSNVADLIFSQENMLVNITSEAKDYSSFEREINSLAQVFPEKGKSEVTLELPSYGLNEAFLTAGNIQYVGKGANLYDWGYEYSGKFEVLKAILNTQFLWENVRMKGGAYGCSASFDYYSGDFALVSYRDPNLKETLNVYDQIPDFISSLDLSKDELDKFIIGCVGRLDPPLTSDRKGSISMIDSLIGMTHELRQKKREEVMSTTLSDIRDFAPIFQKLKESGSICVLGNEGKIKESKDSFDHLVKVFN